MATVIGIFENHYLRKKPSSCCKTRNSIRRFTHIKDTVRKFVMKHGKKIRINFIVLVNKKNYSIIEVAKLCSMVEILNFYHQER
jgi:UDP-glucose 4-epimerase